MEFPLLTKEGRFWKIEISGNNIIRSSWKGDGKRRIVSREITKGKAGRSIEEQVKLEAQSYWNDKRKFMELHDANTRSLEPKSIRPMLAQDYLKHGHRQSFPCLGQPKLDGFRIIATLDDYENVLLITRTGRQIKWFDNIRNDLKGTLLLGKSHSKDKLFFLDGELFTFRLPFQQMSGLHNIKTMTPERQERMDKMEFHIFDCFYVGDERPFTTRYEWLLSNIKETHRIQLVTSEIIETRDGLRDVHERFVREGYEGTILRDPNSKYVHKRSIGLMKYKDFEDEEFEITGYECGVGMDEGCVIWECEHSFKCRMMGTIDVRRWYYEHGDEFVGKQLTVKFQGRSKDGVPRFPVGKGIRS
jgi:ATP-dependent DNA ligase